MKNDGAVRAITEDGSFRVITIDTTETVREILAIQEAQGAFAPLLADLVTGSVLVRETMAPGYRVQLLMRGNGAPSLVADSYPGGSTRGLLTVPEGTSAEDLGRDGVFRVMRVMPRGNLQQGIIPLSEDGVSASLMTYMSDSEQVTSTIAVTCVFDEEGHVERAGGFIVQLLPESTAATIAQITERLESLGDFSTLFEDVSPKAQLATLLEGMPHVILEEPEVFYKCACSEARVLAAMATMGRAEITDIVEAGEVLEVGCDYCRTQYHITSSQLATLLEEPA